MEGFATNNYVAYIILALVFAVTSSLAGEIKSDLLMSAIVDEQLLISGGYTKVASASTSSFIFCSSLILLNPSAGAACFSSESKVCSLWHHSDLGRIGAAIDATLGDTPCKLIDSYNGKLNEYNCMFIIIEEY